MWVAASRLTGRIAKHSLAADSETQTSEKLGERISCGFKKIQEHKKSLFKNFFQMIRFIIAHKEKPKPKIEDTVNEWIQDDLMTKEQWLILQKQPVNRFQSMKGFLDIVGNEKGVDFLTLELKPYVSKIYEMFELGDPPPNLFKKVFGYS
jgi:hypothetical protein